MLAFLKREPGFAIVRALLEAENTAIFAHSVNLCEVFYDFKPSFQNSERSEAAIASLLDSGVIERADLDAAFWRDVALLIAAWRSQAARPDRPREKPKLALGDAFGLALARRLNAPFVTADRTETLPLQSAGFCRAQFI